MDRHPYFYVVDPELQDQRGHYLEYDRTVIEEARRFGFKTILLSHRNFKSEDKDLDVKRTFTLGIWENGKFGHLGTALSFFRELRGKIRKGRHDSRSFVFGPNNIGYQIFGWALLALSFYFRPGPRLIILLRYQLDFYKLPLTKIGFFILEKVARRSRVELVTDSHRLAADYAEITSLPVGILPSPHGKRSNNRKTKSLSTKRRKIRFISLGNARDEKGIAEIFLAIQALSDLELDDRLEFILQIYAPWPDAIKAKVEDARQKLKRNVTFLDQPLSSKEYDDLLDSADVVLLPYWPSVYQSRTSGPFTEAVAAGKPVIVSKGTWMADFVFDYSLGELCNPKDSIDLARAILQACQKIKRHQFNVKKFRKTWSSYHNSRSFLEALVNREFALPFKIQQKKREGERTALIVLPWPYTGIKLSGAGVRIGAMLRFLLSQFDAVHLIEPESSLRSDVPEKIHQHTIRPDNVLAFALAKIVSEVAYIRHGTRNEDSNKRIWIDRLFVNWFAQYIFSGRAKRQFRDFLDKHSIQAIFVEYPFGMPMVACAAAKKQIPVVVTNHDVQSKGIFDSWTARLVERMELSGVKHGKLVSITESDKAYFEEAGFESDIIPNSIDPYRLQYVSDIDPRLFLINQGIVLPKRPVVLFLGSGHFPNIEAVTRLSKLVECPPESNMNLQFVVAGSCMDPRKTNFLLSLGSISDDVLSALYKIASIVIVPLNLGTGSSLKTIEAMALGKVVIGTHVGFRGINVRNNVECIIEDNLEKYPHLINEVIRDSRRMNAISKAAKHFAMKYDFRQTYKKYLDILGVQQRPDSSFQKESSSAVVSFTELADNFSAAQMQFIERQSSFLTSQTNFFAARNKLLLCSKLLKKALKARV